MAVTDANLVLGRLVPDYFPKIFGKSEKEPLDIEASRSAFEQLAQEINASVNEDKKMNMDEIVYGYVALACHARWPLSKHMSASSRWPTRPCVDRSAHSRKREGTPRPSICTLNLLNLVPLL